MLLRNESGCQGPPFPRMGPCLPQGHVRKMAEATAGARDGHWATTRLPGEPQGWWGAGVPSPPRPAPHSAALDVTRWGLSCNLPTSCPGPTGSRWWAVGAGNGLLWAGACRSAPCPQMLTLSLGDLKTPPSLSASSPSCGCVTRGPVAPLEREKLRPREGSGLVLGGRITGCPPLIYSPASLSLPSLRGSRWASRAMPALERGVTPTEHS